MPLFWQGVSLFWGYKNWGLAHKRGASAWSFRRPAHCAAAPTLSLLSVLDKLTPFCTALLLEILSQPAHRPRQWLQTAPALTPNTLERIFWRWGRLGRPSAVMRTRALNSNTRSLPSTPSPQQTHSDLRFSYFTFLKWTEEGILEPWNQQSYPKQYFLKSSGKQISCAVKYHTKSFFSK